MPQRSYLVYVTQNRLVFRRLKECVLQASTRVTELKTLIPGWTHGVSHFHARRGCGVENLKTAARLRLFQSQSIRTGQDSERFNIQILKLYFPCHLGTNDYLGDGIDKLWL